ncbi:hypothetical protein GCM10010149_06660 [Nonomuraea roseoviolacea subsp. roseoviolacea]|uniref:Uncharacterized protein n=1 Tax=Nonomuraea montanisoli TaxID=2741721 RepID=A0A7Y6M3E6_9ACTN|nr:hypothetical protein [Nonomuraea montanisoli]NUW33648.1 hypothetical protein [Nonomuraea montanisoli]
MKAWIANEEFTPVEIGDAYAAERFVSWLKASGERQLEDTLRAFVHSPWQCGGLGVTLLDGPDDLATLRQAVLDRWEPIRAGG